MDPRSSRWCCVMLFFLFFAASDVASQRDKTAMEDLRRQLQGSRWNTSDADFCKWYGVICNSNKSVERLELSRLGLGGDISVLIVLQDLKWLDLSLNDFSGQIPPVLSRMQSLQFLDLSTNRFSGKIPPEIGNMKNLLCLNFSSNELSEGITPELSLIKGLKALNLNMNGLSGGIPEELRVDVPTVNSHT